MVFRSMPMAQADVLENRFLGNFLLIYDNLVVLKNIANDTLQLYEPCL